MEISITLGRFQENTYDAGALNTNNSFVRGLATQPGFRAKALPCST